MASDDTLFLDRTAFPNVRITIEKIGSPLLLVVVLKMPVALEAEGM